MTLQPVHLVPPDAELWGVNYLRAFLAARPEPYAAGVYVSNKKPAKNTARTIAVRRDGGGLSGLFDYPRLNVRVWADKEDDAADLSRLVVGALWAAADGVNVASTVNVFGPSPVEDPSQFLRLVTAELMMRCAAL